MESEYEMRKEYLLAYANNPENKDKRMNAIRRYQEKNRTEKFMCYCCRIGCVSHYAYMLHKDTNKHKKNLEKFKENIETQKERN
jgi:hypothetical protein